jgi:diadenosine tetraphosphate (Ap4A) HIT family hydrolase
MIHFEDDGSFVFVTPNSQRVDVDLNMEDAPKGYCTISAGANAASQAHLNASEVRELIAELEKVAKKLDRQTGRVKV